jgi:hypothetical protein
VRPQRLLRRWLGRRWRWRWSSHDKEEKGDENGNDEHDEKVMIRKRKKGPWAQWCGEHGEEGDYIDNEERQWWQCREAHKSPSTV